MLRPHSLHFVFPLHHLHQCLVHLTVSPRDQVQSQLTVPTVTSPGSAIDPDLRPQDLTEESSIVVSPRHLHRQVRIVVVPLESLLRDPLRGPANGRRGDQRRRSRDSRVGLGPQARRAHQHLARLRLRLPASLPPPASVSARTSSTDSLILSLIFNC